ncbi:MAG: hypothetical protein Q8Q47_05225, partial [Ignavibacteriaceae bacterium]|nr:hypothetical protein [Ignavibacteriaceae bacterium]
MGNKIKIGILGGGQLARMSAHAAQRLGFELVILEKEKKSPAGQLTHHEFVGWVDDDSLMQEFAKTSDVITLENEFVDSERIKFLEDLGKKVFPSSKTIKLIQDKFIQKKTLSKKGIPVPKFMEINDKISYQKISSQFVDQFLLKSRKMG